ncbi:MAG: ATP-binding protein [Gemmataceae bacterium]
MDERKAINTTERTRAVLDYLHGLMATADAAGPLLPDILRDLQRCFEATGVGLAQSRGPVLVMHHSPSSPQLDSWPWPNPDALTQRLRSERGAVSAHAHGGASCLITTIPLPSGMQAWLWLEASGERVWSAADAAGWTLAGNVLTERIRRAARQWPGGGVDQVQLQQRLHDAGVMASRLAHAFDNILTGILGFSELTLTQLDPEALAYQYVAEVFEAARLGNQLTQQLHLFGRMSSAQTGTAPLSRLLAEAEARLRPLLDAKTRLHVAVSAHLPPVAIDAEPLRLVLCHLLDNAHEALEEGGAITVEAGLVELTPQACLEALGNPHPGPHVQVTITDTGPGWSAETPSGGIEPFWSTKPRHRGLGLALVYRLLCAHHGGLRWQPVTPHGTTALVWLPVVSAQASSLSPLSNVAIS